MDENEIAREIVDGVFQVHLALGPGLLESTYEAALEYELKKRGLMVKRQVPVSILYDGVQLNEGYRIDLLVENKVIIELKSVEQLSKVHHKQTLTYIKHADKRLGLLINFGDTLIKNGIKRIVNGIKD